MGPKIDRSWWEHLAPKALHGRRHDVEAMLARWCRTPYGEHWLKVASHPQGVMRIRPGQAIPVAHMVSLGGRPFFMGPQQRMREGHRTVSTAEGSFSTPLAGDEIAIQPSLVVDLVEDPAAVEAALRGDPGIPDVVMTRPSKVFTVPAHVLLASDRHVKRAFVLYQHIFGHGSSYPVDGYFYVGVTTRSWQTRWNEHRRAIEGDSPLLFHRRFREEAAAGRVSYVNHKVMGITDDLEALYDAEEKLVEGHWDDARRLNMIPGGKSGLKYMREHGLLPERVVPMPDERDRMLADWIRANPRRGLPAPWVTDRWKDDEWAVAQICGRDDRLSVEQVRAIRRLAERHGVEEIARMIGARNEAQVARVLEGKTYSRIT